MIMCLISAACLFCLESVMCRYIVVFANGIVPHGSELLPEASDVLPIPVVRQI